MFGKVKPYKENLPMNPVNKIYKFIIADWYYQVLRRQSVTY